MANGEFALAAVEYLALSEGAQRRGLLQSAPLLIAAGMATVEAGEAGRGADLLLQGLEEFRRRGRVRRAALAAGRVLDELRSRGHDSVADQIESRLPEAEAELQAQPSHPVAAVRLPTKCPHCGGNVHPDEVEWADPRSAICDYCGSMLPAAS